jgi:GPH family glycoside/pentoside/hexuronide:cation symporter
MGSMEQSTLTVRQKLGFGVGDIGGNLFFTVIAFWLPVYLTDTVGLLAGLMGTALLVGRIWDAAIDPLIEAVPQPATIAVGAPVR